jgi:hypothetical protein
MSLCWRCEHRAVGHETKRGPRYECTDFGSSKFACYCYRPVKPVILEKLKGDDRPQFTGWMLSARSEFVEVCDDLELQVKDCKGKGKALVWVSKE